MDSMMASSDEEGEILPDLVTDFEIVNEMNQHVSFACLPLLRGEEETIASENVGVFLSGTCNDSLQKVSKKQVLAWRYELSDVQPEMSLLCKGNHWIRLLKPKQIFEPVVRSILITIHFLHFLKHSPEASEDSVWYHLSSVFSIYEVAPCEDDCLNHILLMQDAAKNDKDLASSKYMLRILSEQPTERNMPHMETLPVERAGSIEDEAVDDSSELDGLSEEEEELFDTCCSFCDDGGDILCCEGRCMRSFHPTIASAEGLCQSLGLSEAQVDAISNFVCKNCKYQQHQCFICGKLGSSDISSNAEVFPCVSATCGRFYHPKCVALELQKRNDTQMEEIEEKIAAGEPFVCPAHKCFVCQQVENRKIEDMQFAVCRRCPKSYHRKCLPSEIAFEDDHENNIFQRAWSNLLPKRILIYCLDHRIVPDLGTPLRNHIRFPDTVKEKRCASEQQLTKVNFLPKKRKLSPYHPSESVVWETVKQDEKADFNSRKSISAKLVGKDACRLGSDAQSKANFSSLTSATRVNDKIFPKAYASSTVTGAKLVHEKNKLSSGKILEKYLSKPGSANISCKKLNTVGSTMPLLKKECSTSPVTDLETERRIIALIKDTDSKFNTNEIEKKQKSHYTLKNSQDVFDKNLTKGKVEVTVKAVQTALQKLNNGGTIDDAKAVCSPEMLRQIPLWKRKLEVYLAPFLHGMRYSSYGRHFTKLEKLQEVVDRLHWYVQDSDVIVDFCCGANDFSWLMKKKLDSVGKKCSFKNYDLFPPKNDFNFVQKDWFKVETGELPAGSQLIMGLNPPFGVKASLANKFIKKALEFKPKLLILIVPPITQRLDTRTGGERYDLIWEDQDLLAGKSFYLPGSIDINDKQISQWNNTTPPLYLWSRPDWTGKHREIARRCSHNWHSGQPPSSQPGQPLHLQPRQPPSFQPEQLLHLQPRQPPNFQPPTWNYLMEEQQDCFNDFSSIMNNYNDLHSMLDDVPEANDGQELQVGVSPGGYLPVFPGIGTGISDHRF